MYLNHHSTCLVGRINLNIRVFILIDTGSLGFPFLLEREESVEE